MVFLGEGMEAPGSGLSREGEARTAEFLLEKILL